MKVGIMSMQRVCNYGSFLQAYGLKKTLEAMGHEVVFVDYKPGKPVSFSSNKKQYYLSVLREGVMNIAAKYIDCLFFASKEQYHSLHFKKRYRQEFLPVLGIEKKYNYHPKVDALVIGSDEVFNCLQMNPVVGYSPELFGENNQADILMSYAASFGNTTLEGLQKAGKESELARLLSKFHCISVRDRNSGGIVESLTQKPVEYHLDPVLIYDFSREALPTVSEKDYIVVYAYRNRLSQQEIEAIQAFAKAEGKKIISIGGYQGFCDKYVEGTPFEVLSYICGADYVITDTFHGTIFSIINHRKFVTFLRKGHGTTYGNYEKLSDLLERLGLTARAALAPEDIEAKIREDIDYGAVDAILARERKKTLDYLRNNITKR